MAKTTKKAAKAATPQVEETTVNVEISTSSAESGVESKAELRKVLEALVAKWNESAEFSEYKIMSVLNEKIAEVVSKYTAACETECFKELMKSKNVMLEAAKVMTFTTVAVKDEKEKDGAGKETGKITKVINDKVVMIDPLRLHKRTKDGIGADKFWWSKVERLNMLFTAATAIELKAADTSGKALDFAAIRDSFAMAEESKKLVLKGEDDPSNDEIMLENTQAVIDAMIGEGFTATPEMVVYLRKVHERAGKKTLNVVCSNAKSMRQYMLNVCHKAVTNADIVLDYKQAK